MTPTGISVTDVKIASTRPPARAGSRRPCILAVVALVVVTATAVPTGVAGHAAPAAQAAPDASVGGPGIGGPGIQYEQATAHAADTNRFSPGGSVTAPLSRRSPAGNRLPQSFRSSTVMATNGLRREVFGFLPYWELNSSLKLNYGTLSTIAYFSVGVDRSGNLIKKNSNGSTSTGWGGWTSANLTNVINAAHQQGIRVVLCLTMFAWSSSEAAAQGAFLGNAAARENLAAQAAQAVRDRGADGINLDFEPIASGHSGDFTALVRSMRTQLDALVPGAQLTFDTTAQIGSYAVADLTAPGAADAIFVMGYDFRTSGSAVAGSISPIDGPAYDLADTLAAYLARVPASKVILGLPWYGRAWSTVSDAPNAATQTGTKYGASVAVFYSDAVEFLTESGRRYDDLEQSAWTAYQKQNCTSSYGCVTSWRELYVDDATSLRAKFDLVNRSDLLGVGMWALGYDGGRPELSQALSDKFVNDTTAPEAGIVALAPSQTSETFTVGWKAVDDLSGVASMDVQVAVDGGPWTDWLVGTTQTTAQYTGATGHAYAFRVRATDGMGHVGAYDVTDPAATAGALGPGGFARAVVSSLAVRVGPDTSAQRVAGLDTGALVAITSGPVSAGGYTWYQVTQPIREWPTVSPVLKGVWVASGSGTTPYLVAAPPPHATTVGATGPDTTPPVITATVSTTLFSPNGDGRMDAVRVSGQAAGATTWQLAISPAADLTGTPLRTITGAGETVDATWDGRTDAGTSVGEGPWRLRLTASDAAANMAAAEWIVTLDLAPPAGAPALSPATLSPNGDGWAETATLRWTPGDAASGVIDVLKGTAVLRTLPLASGQAAWTWDGRDGSGRGVADGKYVLRLTLQDAAGNQFQQRLVAVVDRTASTLRWSPGRFSPAAGRTSTVSFTLSRTATTALKVIGPSGKVIRTAWSTKVLRSGRTAWTWDGRDATKHRVARGNYVASLTVRTALGTTTIMRTVVVQ